MNNATIAVQPEERLRLEILEDGRRQAQAILEKAHEEAETILARAAADSAVVRAQRIQVAEAEARRRREAILATVAVKTSRLRFARQEQLLQSIRREVLVRLSDRSSTLTGNTDKVSPCTAKLTLIAEALGGMHGDALVVRLRSTDIEALGEESLHELPKRIGRPNLSLRVIPDRDLEEGGVIIEDASGRERWDNRFSRRLERLWPAFSREIARQLGWRLTNGATETGTRHD